MTSEDDFQKQLDANPDDHLTRLVFADWLQERGDLRAEGYRALGRNRLCPMKDINPSLKTRFGKWYWTDTVTGKPFGHALKDWWYFKVAKLVPQVKGGFATRCEAEDAAALAFVELSASRRAELLAQPVGVVSAG